MIRTYAEARELVEREIAPQWGGDGTLYVSPHGYEDAEAFYVPWGAREWLVDGDRDFMLLNNTATLVEKSTEFIDTVIYSEHRERIARMTPVSA